VVWHLGRQVAQPIAVGYSRATVRLVPGASGGKQTQASCVLDFAGLQAIPQDLRWEAFPCCLGTMLTALELISILPGCLYSHTVPILHFCTCGCGYFPSSLREAQESEQNSHVLGLTMCQTLRSLILHSSLIHPVRVYLLNFNSVSSRKLRV
jgi:hypothetical protein